MSRATILLALAAAVLFGLLLLDIRKAPDAGLTASRFVYSIDAETVSEIAVRRGDAVSVAGLRLTDEAWVLTAPLRTEASPLAFAPILNFISAGMYGAAISRAGVEDFNLATFGLEQPAFTVLFKADNRRHVFHVGPVINNQLFLRKDEEPDRVYQVPPHFYNFFARDASEYRPRTVFTFQDINVTRVTLTGPNGFDLGKTAAGMWMLAQPCAWPGAPDAIAAYLSDLKALRIRDFVRDDTPADGLAEYGLDAPAFTVTVGLAGREPRVIAVGRRNAEKGVYFCREEGGAMVFAVPAVQIDNIAAPDIKLFRNPRLGVFPTETITKLTVDNLRTKERIQLERTEVTAPWRCTWPKDETVGTERVGDFIQTFKETRILAFAMEGADKIPVFDLDQPDIVIAFARADAGGREETVYSLNLKHKGADLVYGIIDDTTSVLRLPLDLHQALDSGLAAFKTLYLVPPDATDNISWLEITGRNRVRFEAKRVEARWEIVTPTDKAPVPEELVKTLDVLGGLRAEGIAALKPENYSVYGFDEPAAQVAFVALGRKFTLHIGRTVPGRTESFVRMEGGDIVYTLAKEKVNELTKDTGLYLRLRN